jgi:hypothetical protein
MVALNESAGGKTREVFEKALGRVLFIDEAYRYVCVCAATSTSKKNPANLAYACVGEQISLFTFGHVQHPHLPNVFLSQKDVNT